MNKLEEFAERDNEIYASLSSLFEHILFRGFEKARQGDLTYTDDMRILLDNFNSQIETSKRLMKKVRKLENERG